MAPSRSSDGLGDYAIFPMGVEVFSIASNPKGTGDNFDGGIGFRLCCDRLGAVVLGGAMVIDRPMDCGNCNASKLLCGAEFAKSR